MAIELDAASDPVEAAKWLAGSIGLNTGNGETSGRVDEFVLGGLDRLIDEWNLDGTYFVETGRAFSIPSSYEADKPVEIVDLYGLSFEGPFRAFLIIDIGNIIAEQRVKALCAAFSSALVLPTLTQIPESHILHVPVLAVDSIERTD